MNFPWNRAESELEREIAHHLHELTAEYERQGHSHNEALLLAKREFGGGEQTKELCRDERRLAWFSGFRQDLVFGWRMMRRTPVVTIAAVLSLALAIGANTAIVSIMDTVLWRDLPLPQPRDLVNVNWQGHGFPQGIVNSAAGSMFSEDGWDIADFFSYQSSQIMRQKVAGNAPLAAFCFSDTVSVSFAGEPGVANQRPVAGNFFSTLQVRPAMGRLLSDNDDTRSAPSVVVVSHRFWTTALHSASDAVGRTIIVENKPKVIAGVLESSFYGLVPGDATDIYAPLHQSKEHLDDSLNWGVQLIARHNPGYPESQLRAALDAAFVSSWTGKLKDPKKAPHVRVDNGSHGLGFLRHDFQSPLLILGGLVSLLLLIACSNIANLLLSRSAARQKEVATRIALGCSRQRLVRQFLTESGMLAGLGGIAAVAVAYLTESLLGQFVVSRMGDSVPLAAELNWRILAIVFATSLLALLLFGLFPAVRASQVRVSRQKGNSGRLLTLGQMAMSVVLVMSAVLFTRNLTSIESSDPGFDRRNLILFDIRPVGQSDRFYFNLEQQLAATPGVSNVGIASVRPMNVGGWWEDLQMAGQSEIRNANVNGVTPNYLSLFSPRLVAGRPFEWTEVASGAKVAVVSEDLAKKLGGRSVLGKRLTFDEGPAVANPPVYEIVGIAPAMAATSMKQRPFVVWLPLDKGSRAVTVVLRTSQPPSRVLPLVRKAMANIDRKLPLVDVVTMEEQISKGLQRERMFAIVCSCFGVLALVLSVVGLYGVMAYNTARRSREIGIRLALGARPGEVVSMIVREGMTVAVLGLLLGLPAVWFGAKYVDKLLFNMKPLEPTTLALSLGTLLLAALTAVAIPAMRASGIQPSQTLRQD